MVRLEFKPSEKVFVNYRIYITIMIYLFLTIPILIISFIFSKYFILFFLALLFLLIGFNYYCLKVAYKKRIYIIEDDKIIEKGGGIFSDYKTELLIKNITFVSQKYPFISNKLFGTGNLLINSAGGIGTEINFYGIDNVSELYKVVIKNMQNNGFSIKAEKLIQEKKTNSLASFFEVVRLFISSLFFAFVILIGGIPQLFLNYNYLGFFLSFLIIFVILIFNILHYFDLKKRFYRIYDDCFYYEEGFLSKNYVIMPIENFSDSSVNQGFISKLFDLYDVTVSCQGTGQEVSFRNIDGGDEFVNNIKEIGRSFNKKNDRFADIKKSINNDIVKKSDNNLNSSIQNKSIIFNKDFVANYKMDLKRSFVLPLFFLLFFLIVLVVNTIFFMNLYPDSSFILNFSFYLALLFFFLFINPIFKVLFTKYEVRENSFYESFKFLSQKTLEFNLKKVTGVVVKESLIDKFFNTCSIKFWSIGSSRSIRFVNIKKNEGLYENILSKVGINIKENSYYNLKSAFNFSDLFKKMFWVLPFYFLGVIVSFVLAFVFNIFFSILGVFLVLIFAFNYWYYKRAYSFENLEFRENYVFFKTGFWIKNFYYVIYDNIKDIETLKYPFSNNGNIKFNVAGEEIASSGLPMSCGFNIKYIENVSGLDEVIDLILKNGVANINEYKKYKPRVLFVTKPDVRTGAVGFSIILAVTVIFSPLIIIIAPFAYFSAKFRTYFIEDYRITVKSGIVYKKQKSIIFEKIDFINNSRGVFDKMFNTGSIIINTTGSRVPELNIASLVEYEKFYNEILKHYNKDEIRGNNN